MSEIAESRHRFLSIDFARFIAFAALIFVIAAPVAGPWQIFSLANFLVFPLFAMVLGISAYLSAERMKLPLLFASSIVRGLLLVLAGQYLIHWMNPQLIALQTLGVLCIIVVPLVLAPSWLLGVLALVSWYFSSNMQGYFTPLVEYATSQNIYLGQATQWLFVGQGYSALTLFGWAAWGICCFKLMPLWRLAGDIAVFLISTTAVISIFWYFKPLALVSGEHNLWTIGLSSLLATSWLLFSVLLERMLGDQDRLLLPFVAAGRMTLSLYGLVLAVIVLYSKYASTTGIGFSLTSWWMLALHFALTFAFALLWQKFLGRTVLYRGPLETLLAWTTGRG